jgi:iron(III) transport system substrate-binding protein
LIAVNFQFDLSGWIFQIEFFIIIPFFIRFLHTRKEKHMVRLKFWMSVSVGLALLAACAPAASPTPAIEADPTPHVESDPEAPGGKAASGDLVIYSGRAEALIKPLIEAFETQYPDIEVALKAGNNSALATQLLEEQANPQADLFLTTELMTAQKMADEGVLQPYPPTDRATLPDGYHHPEWLWTALTLRARVIIYNTDLVKADEAPQSIFDLTDPKWHGQIAAAGSTNGGMQAQVAAIRQRLGDEKTDAWLKGLVDNGVTFFGGHTDVRKAVGAGEFKIGLVNHYYYHLQKAEGSPVAAVYPDQGAGQPGVFLNATAIGVVKGAAHAEAAEKFIEFLLSAQGQEEFAKLNYEYPVIANTPLHPDVRPLTDLRLAEYDFVTAAQSLENTLEMFEKYAIP